VEMHPHQLLRSLEKPIALVIQHRQTWVLTVGGSNGLIQ